MQLRAFEAAHIVLFDASILIAHREMAHQMRAQIEQIQMPRGVLAALRITRVVSRRRVKMSVARKHIKPRQRRKLRKRIRQKRRQMSDQSRRRLRAKSKTARAFERLKKLTSLRAARQKGSILLKKSAPALHRLKRTEDAEEKPILIGKIRANSERWERLDFAQKWSKKLATQSGIRMRTQRLERISSGRKGKR